MNSLNIPNIEFKLKLSEYISSSIKKNFFKEQLLFILTIS